MKKGKAAGESEGKAVGASAVSLGLTGGMGKERKD